MRADKQKLSDLRKEKDFIQSDCKSIIHDYIGQNTGPFKNTGLLILRPKKNSMQSFLHSAQNGMRFVLGFTSGFPEKEKKCVIEAARDKTGIDGLYYTNDVECMHVKEKLEQSFRKGSLSEVLSNFKALIDRQYTQEDGNNLWWWGVFSQP